jgi:hypothetical protein
MLDKIKKLFSKAPIEPVPEVKVAVVEEPKPKKVRKPRAPKAPPVLSAKESATQNGEPYISILKMDLDPTDVNNGAFELDWNDKFIVNLIKAGYKIKQEDTDAELVDRWFQTVCRNVALEVYEQQQADPEKRDDVRIVRSRDIGNGRTEVS